MITQYETYIKTIKRSLNNQHYNDESNLDMIINYNSKRELHHVVETEPWNSYKIKEIYKIKENILNEIANGADEQETLNKYLNDVSSIISFVF